MTTAAIYATREVSWRPSFYRGEQYDADLSLYYLRARYYNPATGRFMSRDPENPDMGRPNDPKTLHKYLYAGGDPVNAVDPTGRGIGERILVIAAYVLPIATVIAIGVASGVCMVNTYQTFGNAIDTLSSLRNPFQVIECALGLLKSIANIPFTNFPFWK